MRYRFGTRVLDTDTRELLDDGAVIEVEPQVFDVLAYLIEHRERVVPKEELLDQIWGDRFVSESALTTRIKQARQAVGDTGRRQETIKTLHGRGYRFIGSVAEDGGGRPTAATTVVRPAVTVSVPATRYAEADGATIAFQTFGDGPDLVFIAGFTTNVEVQWEHPGVAAFLRRLSSFSRVTIVDKRGVGLSDRMPHDDPPSLETRADDLLRVMDVAGIARATVLGSSEGGSLAAILAASQPSRVERLVLHNTWVYGADVEAASPRTAAWVGRRWGEGVVLAGLGPSLGVDDVGLALLARLERQAATPRAARMLVELFRQIDITDILGAITVPTLVLHRVEDPIVSIEQGRRLAHGIPNSRLIELPGADHWIPSGDFRLVTDPIEEFVTGGPAAPPTTDRYLATVLFADIVDSTALATRLGDRTFARLLNDFDAATSEVVAGHRGVLVKTTGDGAVVTFDGPGRAVQAAAALRAATAPLGLTLRCGLHTAEIERRGDDIAGIGVHVASRIADVAAPGEVWVSRTLTDLVAGTGLEFVDRGEHQLAGIERRWELFSVEL